MLMTWVLCGQASPPLCMDQPSLFLRVFCQVVCHALWRHIAPSLHLPLFLEETFLHTLLYIGCSTVILQQFTYCINIHRSHCHGNVRLNNDSKSQRSIPIALCVIINPVDVRGGQSARDEKSHTHTMRAECA